MVTNFTPNCPMGENRFCEGSMCAWWCQQESACSVLVGAKALRIIAASTRKAKTESRSCHNCMYEKNALGGHPPCIFCHQMSNWQPVNKPQPTAAPKRVILNEDTMQPDTTPPSVVAVSEPARYTLVSQDGFTDAEVRDVLRALAARDDAKPNDPRTLICEFCGKPFVKDGKGRDPKTCRDPECIKALHKRQDANYRKKTAIKRAGA